jgi:hypothetical protein
MGTLINDQDLCFWSSISQEVNCLSGTIAVIFQFDQKASTVDPYYAEVTSAAFKNNGVKCPVMFKSPDKTPITGEEGLRFEKSSTVFVAKKDLDARSLRAPAIGDLFQCWGLMYEVTNSSATGGRFSDTGETAEYEVTLMRKTKDVPESVDMDPQRDLPDGFKG